MKYVVYKYHEYNFTKGFIIVAVTDTEEAAKKLIKDKNYGYEKVRHIKKRAKPSYN
jgi:hypothetical protein